MQRPRRKCAKSASGCEKRGRGIMNIIVSGILGHMGREVVNLAENGVRGAAVTGGVDPMFAGTCSVPCVRSFEEAAADPAVNSLYREADCIVLPIVPSVGAVYWYSAIQPMLQNAGVLEKTVPTATMVQPFHLVAEVEGQLGIRFAAQFKYSRDVGRLHDECRLATEEIWREGIAWTKNLHRLYDAVEARRDNLDTMTLEATE